MLPSGHVGKFQTESQTLCDVKTFYLITGGHMVTYEDEWTEQSSVHPDLRRTTRSVKLDVLRERSIRRVFVDKVVLARH